MSLDAYVTRSQDFDNESLSLASRKVYDSQLRGYIAFIQGLPDQIDPHPITEAKVRAYLTHRIVEEKRQFNTIRSDLSALRWAIREESDVDPTKSGSFKTFMAGVKRQLKGGCVPIKSYP